MNDVNPILVGLFHILYFSKNQASLGLTHRKEATVMFSFQHKLCVHVDACIYSLGLGLLLQDELPQLFYLGACHIGNLN
jgi:hypothetical protein